MELLKDPKIFDRNICDLLFLVKNDNYLHNLLKLCLDWMLKDNIVLFVTLNKRTLFPMLLKLKSEASQSQWKKLIIMHFDTISEISKRFLTYHDWTYLPALIVIDLYTHCTLEELYLHKIAETLATFRGYVQSLVIRRLENNFLDSQNFKPSSSYDKTGVKTVCVLALNLNDSVIARKLSVLKNLYYYKSGQIHYEYDSLKERIRKEQLP